MEVAILLQKLIKISSVSGNEDRLATFIFNYLKKHGLKPIKQQGNIVVSLSGTSFLKALIFNAHMDTVSPGDKNKWQYGPYDPIVKNNKVYGLGASDMKGSLAAMIFLITKLSKIKLTHDVWFSFVVKEEFDGSGTKEFLQWFKTKGYLNKYQELSAIIGEPTGLKAVEIGHKGNVFLRVITHGQTGHSSQPEKIKIYAIKKMNKIIEKIPLIQKTWQQKYQDKHLGKPTIALTGIKAGVFKSPNKFPDKCQIQLDIRTTPKLHQNIKKEIKKWLKDQASYNFIYQPAPYGWCGPEEKIVKTVKELFPRLRMTFSTGATDQCFFTQYNIPAIIFGPGEKDMAHKANEWINLKQVQKTSGVYLKIINKYFGK